jgi:hypothetical protein
MYLMYTSSLKVDAVLFVITQLRLRLIICYTHGKNSKEQSTGGHKD